MTHFLLKNVEVFIENGTRIGEVAVKRLIRQGQVMDVKVKQGPIGSATTLALSSATLTPSFASTTAHVDMSRVDVSRGGWSLYQRGEISEWFTLIIDGCAQIRAGEDDFVLEVGNWSPLGARVFTGIREKAATMLMASETDRPNLHPFVPDFSATLTASSRILRISRMDFMAELKRSTSIVKEAIEGGPELKRATGDGSPSTVTETVNNGRQRRGTTDNAVECSAASAGLVPPVCQQAQVGPLAKLETVAVDGEEAEMTERYGDAPLLPRHSGHTMFTQLFQHVRESAHGPQGDVVSTRAEQPNSETLIDVDEHCPSDSPGERQNQPT